MVYDDVCCYTLKLPGPRISIAICQDGRGGWATSDAAALAEAGHFKKLFSHYMQHAVSLTFWTFSFFGDVDAQLQLLDYTDIIHVCGLG